MRTCRIAASLALLVLLVVAQTAEAGVRKSGLTGASFLKIGVGARPVALGSAYTTVTGDVNQLFWNPAGIALETGKQQVTLFHNQWIADLGHDAVGYTRDMGSLGTLGFSLVTLGMGGIDADRDVVPQFILGAGTFTPNDTETSSTYDYRDLAVGVSWGRHISDKLDLGLTGKIVSQSIDGVSAQAYALDAGCIYRVGYRNTRIGARINNLGSDIKFYDIGAPLPLIFSIGVASDVWEQADGKTKVTLLADATKPQDAEQLVYTAIEVQALKKLSLRTGYKFNYLGVTDKKVDEVTRAVVDAKRTEEGLTAGVGLGFTVGGYDAAIDYAYTDFGILDSVHRVSLSLGL
jgi:hypothetical protein